MYRAAFRFFWIRSGFIGFLFWVAFCRPVAAEAPPVVVWANRAGGTFPDSATAIAADAAGNIYVAGTFSGTATFGDITLTASVGTDLFLGKLSPAGTWLWVKDVEAGVPELHPFHLLVDSTGSPVLTTTVPGDAVGDGLEQLFVAKFNGSGTSVWTKKFTPGGLSSIVGGALALDSANNLYVTGAFGNRVDFGGTTLTDSGNGDIFLLKLSPAGTTLAVRQFGQPGPILDHGAGLVLDSVGNVYLAATFGGSVAFGTSTLTSAGGADVALVKFDSSLNPLWAKRVGNPGADAVFELTRDSANNLFLLGSFSEDTLIGPTRITPDIADKLLVARFSTAGDFAWISSLGYNGTTLSETAGFTTDTAGNVLVAGRSFLTKLDAAGRTVWSRLYGLDFGIGEINGLAVQNYTNIFIAASFSGTAKLDTITLVSAGQKDALIGHLFINTTPPPIITVQPKEQTVLTDVNVTFSVTATGADPLRYQWLGNDLKPIPGATNISLTLTNVTVAANGYYSVLVSNPGGTTASALARLFVNPRPPVFTLQPLSQVVDLGGEARFTALATGVPTLVYQWRFRGTNLLLQNSTLLVIRGARTNDAGPYTMVVGNSAGYSTSSIANLTVRIIPPAISIQPTDAIGEEGGSVSFAVAATGSEPLTYRWRRDGVDVGSNRSTLDIVGIKEGDAGSYTVTVSNAAGSVTSLPASLSLRQPTLSGEPFTWSVVLSSANDSLITRLALDSARNIYLTGNQPNLPLPGLTNVIGYSYGLTVAKLNPDGRGLWRAFGWGANALKVTVGNLCVDSTGNVFVAGNYAGGAFTLGGTTLPVPGAGSGNVTLFLAKFKADGTMEWAKRVSSARAEDLVPDGLGNLLVAGTLIGSATASPVVAGFGSTNISTVRPRAFLAQVNALGNFTWVRSAGPPAGATSSFAFGEAIARDPAGELWLAGSFATQFEFGTNSLSSPGGLFLARLDDQGLPRRLWKYDGFSKVRQLALPTAGGLVLATGYPGVSQSPGDLLRLDSEGHVAATFHSDFPFMSVSINPAGSVLFSRQTRGEGSFGDLTLRAPNGQDFGGMFLLKPDFTPELARSVTGLKGREQTTAGEVVLSSVGSAVFSGSFFGTNVVFGPLVARSSTGSGAFLAELAAPTTAAAPVISAQISAGKLTLSWPLSEGWVLERATTLGVGFTPFANTGTTNLATHTVTLEIVPDRLGSFYRLYRP